MTSGDDTTTALLWIATVAVWAGAAVWVERDAQRIFGRSAPWKQILMGMGVVLLLGASSQGVRIMEPMGLFLSLVALAYAALRGARLGWWGGSGVQGGVAGFLCEIARTLGVDPQAARTADAGRAEGGEKEVILLT